ncbi:TldD/PmbA family protein [Hippea maritima]|uniref:Peptidase U62 modulator of DNA gyrase n=1 Tax=Hippea maritima (strain ATCC 700847 / DSM 10411 / MH2) TaxID=760142 RepID=F2LWS9_HIPMA|nr:TldD/PmbA family protein [Hippea maritima]AEA33057.1 peptidase U62 modulator of DNA gyrase [Hippea maritima DSM 10411]
MYESAADLLKNSNSDFFDIYREKSYIRMLQAKNGQIEDVKVGFEEGVGVRLVKGLSVFYSSSTNTDEDSVYKIAKFITDVANPKQGRFDITPFELKRVEMWGGYKPDLERIAEIYDEFCSVAYKKAEVKQVSLTFSDRKKQIEIINEKGELLKEERIYTVLFFELTAREKQITQTIRRPFGVLGGFEYFDGWDFKGLAEEETEKLLNLLKAPPLKAQKMTVVLSSQAGGTMIHEAVGHGLEADLVYENLSVYKDKLGQKVASEKITVVDDATRPKMRGSFYYDDEGERSKNTVLIENGVLKNYMFDKMYARLADKQTTGNSRRESYRFAPIVRMSNTYILPGEDNPEDIIASVDYGLLVKRMGGGQVNPTTGDFVFEVAEGYLIENGKVKHMVRGATLIGNGPNVLNEIDMVGSDFGVEVGTCGKSGQGVPVSDGEPTLRIPSIMVGGSSL